MLGFGNSIEIHRTPVIDHSSRCYNSPMPPHMPPPNTPRPEQLRQKSGFGPTIGIAIIIILMLFGGLYFWGAWLNANSTQEPLPFIPGDPVVELQ